MFGSKADIRVLRLTVGSGERKIREKSLSTGWLRTAILQYKPTHLGVFGQNVVHFAFFSIFQRTFSEHIQPLKVMYIYRMDIKRTTQLGKLLYFRSTQVLMEIQHY